MALCDNLQLMLERGQDSPLLRFALGQECLKAGDLMAAIDHLRQAVDQNPRYSAAWEGARRGACARGLRRTRGGRLRAGIAAAQAAGDVQAAKEMGVFLRRLRKNSIATQ